MSDLFQALASPVRRDILFLLREGDLAAGDISDRLKLGKTALSGHLNVLKVADLVKRRRDGTRLIYSLNLTVVETVITSLMALRDQGASAAKESLS